MRCRYGGIATEIASVINKFALVVMVPYISFIINFICCPFVNQ